MLPYCSVSHTGRRIWLGMQALSFGLSQYLDNTAILMLHPQGHARVSLNGHVGQEDIE